MSENERAGLRVVPQTELLTDGDDVAVRFRGRVLTSDTLARVLDTLDREDAEVGERAETAPLDSFDTTLVKTARMMGRRFFGQVWDVEVTYPNLFQVHQVDDSGNRVRVVSKDGPMVAMDMLLWLSGIGDAQDARTAGPLGNTFPGKARRP